MHLLQEVVIINTFISKSSLTSTDPDLNDFDKKDVQLLIFRLENERMKEALLNRDNREDESSADLKNYKSIEP